MINIFEKGMKKMKSLLYLPLVLLIFWACKGTKEIGKVEITEPEAVVDSVEYGVETFDAKFESWYALHNSPSTYRSLEYYENWNKQYVQAWNLKATSGGKNSFFQPIVGYDPKEKYGFEVNHKLFHYFQYVENVLKIEIMPGGPRTTSY
jgi:hypothetical protein